MKYKGQEKKKKETIILANNVTVYKENPKQSAKRY